MTDGARRHDGGGRSPWHSHGPTPAEAAVARRHRHPGLVALREHAPPVTAARGVDRPTGSGPA